MSVPFIVWGIALLSSLAVAGDLALHHVAGWGWFLLVTLILACMKVSVTR